MDTISATHSSVMRKRWLGRARGRGLAMALLLALALLGGWPGARRDAALAAVGSSISGAVVRDGAGGAVSDALVSASGGGVVRAAPTGPGGEYTLALLPAGAYELSVRPTAVLTRSPDWVYTGAPLLVSVPPDQAGQNLMVRTASVTITGQLALPAGASGDFGTPGQRAWVRAENQEGQGNSVLVAASGNFTIRVLPGLVLLRITLENSDWAVAAQASGLAYRGEAGATIQVDGDPRTQPIDPIALTEKQATISGKVTLTDGVTAAPQGIPVRAWRLDGAEFEQTSIDAAGLYSMKVISGTWALRAVPLPDQLYGGQYFVPAQPPKPVRVLSDTATLSDQNLEIAVADVTVHGGTVPAGAGVNGRVYTLYQQGGRPELGPSAPLADGSFTSLRLSSSVATTYTFGIYFPPDIPYTALSRVTHVVTPGVTLTISIPIALDNSHISGTLRLDGGAAALGVPGSIWGASDGGGWARARVNPASAGYDLRVATSDTNGQGGSYWRVRAFVDPTSGYIVQRPRVQRVFLPFNNGAGSAVGDVDFGLLQLASLATIHGRVTTPSGAEGIPGARVTVREFTGDRAEAFERWAITDIQGNYSVRVPPGAYRVSASLGLPRSALAPLIAPAPSLVTVGAGGSATANLSFRLRDALVRGLVTYNGVAHPALVRARSEDGAVVVAPALPAEREGGNYILGLKAGLRWTIEAIGSEGDEFLHSNQVAISPTLSLIPLPVGETLVLTKTESLPDSQALVFPADQDQLIALSNGAQVQAPAGAFAADSRLVGLIVRPLPDLAGDGGAQPISFGYRLSVYDNTSRQPISRFLRPVTLVIPFTKAQLDALGITSDRLVPAYWDEASASWKAVENVAVIPDDSGGGTVNMTVDHFTDFALLGAPGGAVYLPAVMR